MEHEHESFVVRFLKKHDERLVRWALRHSNAVMVGTLLLVLTAGGLFSLMGKEFLPPFNEGTFTVTAVLPPGTSLRKAIVSGRPSKKRCWTSPRSRGRAAHGPRGTRRARRGRQLQRDRRGASARGGDKDRLAADIRAHLSDFPAWT
jgi:HME family heavy-metal exporter